MSPTKNAALELIAATLCSTYDLGPVLEVSPYLLPDAALGALGLCARGAPEQVFVVEYDADEPELGLYLCDEVTAELAAAGAAGSIDALGARVALPALMYATEGVSHLLWLTQRRRAQEPVRQLELELQAELDKFVIALMRCEGRRGLGLPGARELFFELFEKPQLGGDLNAEERERYRSASQAAAWFLRGHMERVAPRGMCTRDLLPALRRYCRQGLASKLR